MQLVAITTVEKSLRDEQLFKYAAGRTARCPPESAESASTLFTLCEGNHLNSDRPWTTSAYEARPMQSVIAITSVNEQFNNIRMPAGRRCDAPDMFSAESAADWPWRSCALGIGASMRLRPRTNMGDTFLQTIYVLLLRAAPACLSENGLSQNGYGPLSLLLVLLLVLLSLSALLLCLLLGVYSLRPVCPVWLSL